MHLIPDYLEKHEGQVSVKRLFRQWGIIFDVALSKFAARAGYKVVDALLWFDALVEVIMPGEDCVYTVLDEEGL